MDNRQFPFPLLPIFGLPGYHQGGFQPPPQGPPYGGGPQNISPPGPPPSFTPEQGVQTFAIDSGAIQGCLYRFTYIWLRREAFWFFPTFVGRRSVSGFRWNGRTWSYFGIDLRHIQSFQCF